MMALRRPKDRMVVKASAHFTSAGASRLEPPSKERWTFHLGALRSHEAVVGGGSSKGAWAPNPHSSASAFPFLRQLLLVVVVEVVMLQLVVAPHMAVVLHVATALHVVVALDVAVVRNLAVVEKEMQQRRRLLLLQLQLKLKMKIDVKSDAKSDVKSEV